MTSPINYENCLQIRVKPGAELPAAYISPIPGAADSNIAHGTILAVLPPTSQEILEPLHMLAAEIVTKNKDKLEAVGAAYLPLSEATYRLLNKQLILAYEHINLGTLGDEREIVNKIKEILTFAEVVGPPELLDLPS